MLVGIGWLDPGVVKRWQQGQIDCLETVVRTNPPRISEATKLFRSWAAAQGLTPSETRYVARTPSRESSRARRMILTNERRVRIESERALISPWTAGIRRAPSCCWRRAAIRACSREAWRAREDSNPDLHPSSHIRDLQWALAVLVSICWARGASPMLPSPSLASEGSIRTLRKLLENLERAKGFEPSTPTLARLCSTPELHPHPRRVIWPSASAGPCPSYAKELTALQPHAASPMKRPHAGLATRAFRLPGYARHRP